MTPEGFLIILLGEKCSVFDNDVTSCRASDAAWTLPDSSAPVSTSFCTIPGLAFQDAPSYQRPPDQAVPDVHAGAAHPLLALEPTAHVLKVPVTGLDNDSPWSADERSGPADAAFGAVDFVTGPVMLGPAEPDQAEQSMMQVSNSVSQLQDSQLLDAARLSVQQMPAEMAQAMELDASSPEEVQAVATQMLSQPMVELTQQVPSGQLPGHGNPAPVQQTADAAKAVEAATSAANVTAEHPAAPSIGQAAHEESSPQAGHQPLSSTPPLYTCHLQGLGGAELDMYCQEHALRVGEQSLTKIRADVEAQCTSSSALQLRAVQRASGRILNFFDACSDEE